MVLVLAVKTMHIGNTLFTQIELPSVVLFSNFQLFESPST